MLMLRIFRIPKIQSRQSKQQLQAVALSDKIVQNRSHNTNYYKLAIFIVYVIFNPSLCCTYCSHFTVAAPDRIATRRIKGDTRLGMPTFVHIVITGRTGGGTSRFISREDMADFYLASHRTAIHYPLTIHTTISDPLQIVQATFYNMAIYLNKHLQEHHSILLVQYIDHFL